MAKKSKIVRNIHRQAVVDRYAEVRQEARRKAMNPHLAADERSEAMRVLHSLPRDASPTRVRGRGASDGRPRGFIRKFGLSRVQFRELALRGDLPGVTKSSW